MQSHYDDYIDEIVVAQNLKVLKHFLYIECESEMHSGVLNSLNRDIITSFSLSLTQIFQKIGPLTQVYQWKAALMSLATAS